MAAPYHHDERIDDTELKKRQWPSRKIGSGIDVSAFGSHQSPRRRSVYQPGGRTSRRAIEVSLLADPPNDDAKRLTVLASDRLNSFAPTAIQQDGDGLYACAGWRIGLTHDGGKRSHGLACVSPAQ
jgi:hypothetical protein